MCLCLYIHRSADSLAKFLEDEIDEDITSVPGIGAAAAKKLKAGEDGVNTAYQLFGRFLTLKSAGCSAQEHCDAMWFWLQAKGVSSHRSGIVQCLAEKLEIMMPGLYQGGEN